MPRRPRAVGSHGEISYRTLGPRKVRALTWVRDADGRPRQVTRQGTSREHARDELLKALVERPAFGASEITAESLVEQLIEAWFSHLDDLVETGELKPNTAQTYKGAANNHVRRALGVLRVRELANPGRCDVFLRTMRKRNGAAITRTTRTVLSELCRHAIRLGAMKTNPVRDVGRIRGGRKRKPRALTAAERGEWFAKMEADEVAVARDIPDLTKLLMATGCRIGEMLAVSFDDGISVDDKTVAVDWNIVRVKGQGLQRMSTKTEKGERTLRLPSWAVDIVIRRGDRLGWTGPLFPVPAQRRGGQRWAGGVWRDPSNTSGDLRGARDRAGFGWVTSHVFRKTVATVMEESGFTAREIADQLGHEKVSMTQDVYMGRAVVSEGALALEDIFGDDEAEGKTGNPAEPAAEQPQRRPVGRPPSGPEHGSRAAYLREQRRHRKGEGPEPCGECREANRRDQGRRRREREEHAQ